LSSKAPPWLRWWWNDWISGTQQLTTDARYVYRELLDAQWFRGGRLPADIRELRRMARAESWSLQRFRKVWAEIQGTGQPNPDPKFEEDERGYFNRRLERERKAALGASADLSDSGKRGALVRWGCPECRRAGHPNPERFDGSEETCPDCGANLLD